MRAKQFAWVLSNYRGGIRGVFDSASAAETEIANIRAYHDNVGRTDFTVEVYAVKSNPDTASKEKA